MKLGSLKEGGRDGTLVVVARDLTRAVRATGIAPTLQRALEDWSNVAPRLNALSEALDAGNAVLGSGGSALDAIMNAPLVRCDVAPWHFLGISLAGWNAILSLGGALVIVVLMLKRQRR